MKASKYLNQYGMAKVCHDPCYALKGAINRYAIHILPHMAWDPTRLQMCFPSRDAAEAHLAMVYDEVELVSEKRFDALCRNLYVLPRDFSNCK